MGLYTVTMARKNGCADSVGNHAPATSVARTLHGRALIVKEDIVGNAAGEGAAGVTAKKAKCVALTARTRSYLRYTGAHGPTFVCRVAATQQCTYLVVYRTGSLHRFRSPIRKTGATAVTHMLDCTAYQGVGMHVRIFVYAGHRLPATGNR